MCDFFDDDWSDFEEGFLIGVGIATDEQEEELERRKLEREVYEDYEDDENEPYP